MSNLKNKFIQLQGSELCFSHSELDYICHFFDCQSPEDLVLAVRRYENLFISRDEIHPGEINSALALALSLAGDLYADFHCLEKPLIYKSPKKRNGLARKERNLPPDILEVIQNEKQKIDWNKKPKLIEVIKRLQRKNILQKDLKASTLEKDIQELARREAHIKEVFKDIKPKINSKSQPE